MNKILLFIGAGVVVLGLLLISLYNSLVGQTNAIEGQWAQVDTQYQRRLDLIPNLVASTKGVMAQETQVFTAIADARTRYSGAQTVNDKAQAATDLETGLGRLLVIMENYPTLKSNETVSKLMDELAGTENRVSVERRRFNELVQTYNGSIKTFPTNLLASVFGFTTKKYFESESGADKAPTVDLVK